MTKIILILTIILFTNTNHDNQTKIIGSWVFDLTQNQFDCEGKKVDYSNVKNTTIITFKSDGSFNGQIWGTPYFGKYYIKNDSLVSISNSPAMEGTQTEHIYRNITDTLQLISITCDQRDTLRYIRKKETLH